MNFREKRTARKTIRIRQDILEIAEQICDEHEYSLADIFEMGVLLLDDKNDSNLLLQSKFYEDILERFTKLEEKVSSDCKKIQERIIDEINLINKSKEHNNEILKSKKLDDKKSYLDEALSEVVGMIHKRENATKTLDPLGKSYYEFISSKYSVPTHVIVQRLYELGFDKNLLIDVGMNPDVRWQGYTTSKKSETLD